MASAALRDELTCCICMDIYRDPVTLPCGHSFCRLCIVGVLDTQEESGAYKCPECRAESQERPALEKNRKLGNIAKRFLYAHPDQEEAGIPCTYCIQSPVPAVKTCLLCEASLCEDHLRVHSKSAEHVITEPTMSLEKRKCIADMKDPQYYCLEDTSCICVSCSLAGEHRGHQVETLNEASEKKKKKLRNILKKLKSKRKEAETKVQNLQEIRKKVQEKAAGVTERVTALIRGLIRQLEALEKRVLSEISRQEEQVSLRVSDLIRQLEIKKEELSRKMGDIEELCNMTDPVTVLQEKESDRDDYCDVAEEDTETHDKKVHSVKHLDLVLISMTLFAGLAGILTGIKRRRRVAEASDTLLEVNAASDMSLDVNTANNYVSVSGDLKTASWLPRSEFRPETSDRFNYYSQVLSCKTFSSGRHYWEVQCSEPAGWRVGMAYPSIDRRGDQSCIGMGKSWALGKWSNDHYHAIHDGKLILLPHPPSCRRFGIYLDYKVGRLSFYELCDPIRHVHTFTAAFTEPLHAILGVFGKNVWLRI